MKIHDKFGVKLGHRTALSISLPIALSVLGIFLVSSTYGQKQSREEKAEAAVAQLTSDDRKVRLKAVVALVDDDQIGYVPESALEPLLKMATEKDELIRSWSMSALGRLGPAHLARTRPLLLEGIKAGGKVTISAAEALGILKDAESVKPLVELTDNEDRTTRSFAADALSRIGTPYARAGFLAYAKENIPELLEITKGADEIRKADASMYLFRMVQGMKRLELMDSPEGRQALEAWQKAAAKC
jgi:HEAT repeat protein